MNFVFCCDAGVTAALHVAARSVLEHLAADAEPVFWIFSDELGDDDLALLEETLAATGRKFRLERLFIDPRPLEGFQRLDGSLAAYYRLLVPEQISCSSYLYLDVDTLCRVDLAPLFDEDLGGCPIGLCPEGPIGENVDRDVLGDAATGDYYNSGVMLVDVEAWRMQGVTRACLDFLASTPVIRWDQSALNHVLHGRIHPLARRYNCFTNVRANWPALKAPRSGRDRLLHFVDFPKPWSPGGRWVHAFGKDWWSAYQNTRHYAVAKGLSFPARNSLTRWRGYRKALKDRVLFEGYNRGWLKRVKAVPAEGDGS